jgi:hypothetical protein
MPLEGHWARQNTPLRRTTVRERIAMAVVASVLAVATVTALVYLLATGGTTTTSAAGCVDVTAAHTTGGARLHACGSAAARMCRAAAHEDTPLARALRPQCKRN